MPAEPRHLKLEFERLIGADLTSDATWAAILDVIDQAEELARSLPPEKTCKSKTWKKLRASELLEELIMMAIFPMKAWDRPDLPSTRWTFGCISALYHAFRVMDMKPDGAAEADLVRLSPLLISRYARWFGSPYVDRPGLSQSRRQILLLVYRLCAPAHVEDALPDEMNETFFGTIELDEIAQIIVPSMFHPIPQGQPQLDKNVVWAGCHILNTYGKTKGVFNISAEGYVKKYGEDYMAKRRAAIIESTPASMKLLLHVSSLVQYLLFA
ncbi:hypothetical protein FS837_003265 [Tulasnella sp. UAMH 9824]|nr:hypothetical protein FS837_003265 [Tulasnella sp. UAMH 9824]